MAETGTGDGARPRKAQSLARAASVERDPEWRAWFQRVDRLRKEAEQKKYRKTIYAPYEKDGQSLSVSRKRAKPVKAGTLLHKEEKKAARKLSVDTALIRDAWQRSVGDIASESDIHSFKNGVLTISVFSTTLLQEIRQFHQDALLRDLRDIWPASIPLVRIVYRPGKR